ncbi:hypothetical protein EJ04DRAFT_478746 [Polyplosphaeria fusca]|uniref:Peptidase S54 rhomboid domain-containing protein n=1 Tax=Polyplosphaeria fusca TaxID=682080 RepID=A0A9P4QHX7_9PLEO|nr:hypothetical protein EJ04DRAFT_478746 [Polyplosphaeria fusca]
MACIRSPQPSFWRLNPCLNLLRGRRLPSQSHIRLARRSVWQTGARKSPRAKATPTPSPDPESPEFHAALVQRVNHIKYLTPALYAIVVSGGIYLYSTYLQARHEVDPPKARSRPPPPTTDLPGPVQVASQYWRGLDPISQVSHGIIGTCVAVHLSRSIAPMWWIQLWHMPINPVYHTLFTSTFVHSGLAHLGVNMWAAYNFLPPVGYSPLFNGSPYHVAAFFLSAGVWTGYAQHLTTKFAPSISTYRSIYSHSALMRGGGASGALFAAFGVFCMQYPEAKIGIIFIPIYFAASSALPFFMAFDAYGMIKGFRGLNLGHAAHLSGALIGIAYSYFDGRNNLWYPLVGMWKAVMMKRGGEASRRSRGN